MNGVLTEEEEWPTLMATKCRSMRSSVTLQGEQKDRTIKVSGP